MLMSKENLDSIGLSFGVPCENGTFGFGWCPRTKIQIAVANIIEARAEELGQKGFLKPNKCKD